MTGTEAKDYACCVCGAILVGRMCHSCEHDQCLDCSVIEPLPTRGQLQANITALTEALALEKDKPAKDLPRLVVCAVITRDGQVLLERRAPAGVPGLDNKWDLPGGKVESGEAVEDAIVREIAEELGIGVRPGTLIPYLPTSTWTYADDVRRHWILAAYPCTIISGEPVCTETLRWFALNCVERVDLLDADRRLIVLARAALNAK